jgi:hypothetical protein
MRKAFLFSIVAILVLGPMAAAQQSSAVRGNNLQNANSAGTQVPVSSPEPITMIALAGGAAAAGGLAHRRRNRK